MQMIQFKSMETIVRITTYYCTICTSFSCQQKYGEVKVIANGSIMVKCVQVDYDI